MQDVYYFPYQLTLIETAIAKLPSSLRESALACLVETSLHREDSDISYITDAELLPDFLPAIRTRLASEPTLITSSPAAKGLLLKAIEHAQEVDLSAFQSLSAKEHSEVLSRISEAVSLSLSGPSISEGLLTVDFSAKKPALRQLYVLDAPNLPLQPVLKLMHEPGILWIYHADMFRRPFQSRPSLEGGLQQAADHQRALHELIDKQLSLKVNSKP